MVDSATTDNDADTSFSDPFDEEDDKVEDGSTIKQSVGSIEIDDDYAKTFDSDGEENTSRQDVSSANIDQKMHSPPASVSVLAPDSLPVATSTTAPAIAPTMGRDIPSSQIPFPPTATTAGDASVATGSTATPAALETTQSKFQPPSYEAVSNGEIDIQQLLDNITANAELNASNSTNATPTSANSNLSNFPPGTSGLPAHASLPPRPQVSQQAPMHQAYPLQGDIRKYHAGPPNFPPAPGTSYRPLGVAASIVAAGAPGTSTDPRNVLPPPPSTSFHPGSSTGAPPSLNYTPYPDNHRMPAKESQVPGIETAGAADDSEISWSPAIQKLYEDFLADERMYVSEGLWDRFPNGSRLFIGKPNIPATSVERHMLIVKTRKFTIRACHKA